MRESLVVCKDISRDAKARLYVAIQQIQRSRIKGDLLVDFDWISLGTEPGPEQLIKETAGANNNNNNNGDNATSFRMNSSEFQVLWERVADPSA